MKESEDDAVMDIIGIGHVVLKGQIIQGRLNGRSRVEYGWV